MRQDILVPRMGESITEAHIGNLLKPTGSQVKTDEEVLELETDKVNQVLYAPVSGVITWTVKPQDVVQIGQVIGYVEEGQAPAKEQEKKEEVKEAPKPPPEVPKEGKARIFKEEIVQELAEKPHPAPQPTGDREVRKPMSRIRQTIAHKLVEAQAQTAMLTTFNEVDMLAITQLREKYKESFQKKYGVKLGFLSFFVKAVISALQEFPHFNAYIDGEDLVVRQFIDMGIAISTDRGLVVPVVRDADHLAFHEIETTIGKLTQRAREGGLSIDDIRGGSFTITNGGTFGSLLSTPILNFPQSGILGMHNIVKRPVVIDDEIAIRPMMYIALTYDHRIVDGREAVLFLVHVKNKLEDPSRMLLGI